MSTLAEKASQLRGVLPKSGGGNAPEDSGIRLATFPRPEGAFLVTSDTPEGRGGGWVCPCP